MSNRCMVTLIAAALLNVANDAVTTTQHHQKPKPIIEDPIHTYFNGPPESLPEMIVDADLVLSGRMTRFDGEGYDWSGRFNLSSDRPSFFGDRNFSLRGFATGARGAS